MAMSEKPKREDGRRPLMLYLDPQLIHALKRLALDEHTHVYLLVEEMLKKGLPAREHS